MSHLFRPSASIHPLRFPARSVTVSTPSSQVLQPKDSDSSIRAVLRSLAAGLITASEADELIFLEKLRMKQQPMGRILVFPKTACTTG